MGEKETATAEEFRREIGPAHEVRPAEPGVGPASAGLTPAPGDPGAARATNLNSSKSNTYRESGPAGDAPVAPGAEEQRISNLNLSKSNVDRMTGPGSGEPGGIAVGDEGVPEDKIPPKSPR